MALVHLGRANRLHDRVRQLFDGVDALGSSYKPLLALCNAPVPHCILTRILMFSVCSHDFLPLSPNQSSRMLLKLALQEESIPRDLRFGETISRQ